MKKLIFSLFLAVGVFATAQAQSFGVKIDNQTSLSFNINVAIPGGTLNLPNVGPGATSATINTVWPNLNNSPINWSAAVAGTSCSTGTQTIIPPASGIVTTICQQYPTHAVRYEADNLGLILTISQ